MTDLFDPAQITTITSLAAAAVLAVVQLLLGKGNKRNRHWALGAVVACVGIAALVEVTQHVDPCAAVPAPTIGEICAEGAECDGGSDFIELVNLNDEVVPLACFALRDLRSPGRQDEVRTPGNPALLEGELQPDQVVAFGAESLQFNLSREGDNVTLLRAEMRPGRQLQFTQIDNVLVDEQRVYRRRLSDGSWESLDRDAVLEEGRVGTFGTRRTIATGRPISGCTRRRPRYSPEVKGSGRRR